MATSPPGGQEPTRGESDFVRGALGGVVDWFPTLPAIVKWVFAALFLWYVFAALAQIDPRAPFVSVYTLVDDRIALARAEDALAARRRDEFVEFLKSRLDSEAVQRMTAQERYEALLTGMDRRLRALEATHKSVQQNPVGKVPRGTLTKQHEVKKQ